MWHKHTAAQVISSDSASSHRTINALLVNELPQFNSLALQMIWSVLGTFSCLHKDLAADMEQLFQSFAQQVNSVSVDSNISPRQTPLSSSPSSPLQLSHSSLSPRAFWQWAESAVLEGARRLETLCLSVQDALNAPVAQVSWDERTSLRTSDTVSQTNICLRLQPLSPSSQRRLKQLTDKHGSGQIYQVMGTVVASRDLDLNLAKGELVAILSEADTRGDRRRWLVDAGGKKLLPG